MNMAQTPSPENAVVLCTEASKLWAATSTEGVGLRFKGTGVGGCR